VIDQVADIYLRIRSEGGRFFVSDEGALYWDEVVGGKRVIAFFQIT
jgi:phosphatidylglycerophosphatase A